MLIMFLLPVMLLLLSGGSARVVENFKNKCDKFFAQRISPTVLPRPRYIQICQTLDNKPYYATLYDTNNKIPVYSAYKFTGSFTCGRQDKWYIEPQLDDNKKKKAGPNMESKRRRRLINQASNEDYKNSGYHRGHLAPVSQANKQRCADATFTLTNAAPQYPSFNSGQWRVTECNMAETVITYCKDNTAYFITGVVPGSDKLNNRVNVPSHFWSAFCCQSNNQLISGAVWGINSNENLTPSQMTVRELETTLGEQYGDPYFYLFGNNCRNSQHVSLIVGNSLNCGG